MTSSEILQTLSEAQKCLFGTKDNGQPRALYDLYLDFKDDKKKKKKKDKKATSGDIYSSTKKHKKKKKKKKNKKYWSIYDD